MIIYNFKQFIKKLLELINKFNKVTRYKIKTQQSVVVLHTTSNQYKIEIKNTIPLSLVSKRIKYIEIHLTKEVKDYTLKTIKQC